MMSTVASQPYYIQDDVDNTFAKRDWLHRLRWWSRMACGVGMDEAGWSFDCVHGTLFRAGSCELHARRVNHASYFYPNHGWIAPSNNCPSEMGETDLPFFTHKMGKWTFLPQHRVKIAPITSHSDCYIWRMKIGSYWVPGNVCQRSKCSVGGMQTGRGLPPVLPYSKYW